MYLTYTLSSVVTSNIHETTLWCVVKISFKVYLMKQKGKPNILLFCDVWDPSKLDISIHVWCCYIFILFTLLQKVVEMVVQRVYFQQNLKNICPTTRHTIFPVMPITYV